MKLTDEQRRAAAMYWTHFMTGEINPPSLQVRVVPFMAHMEIMHRKKYIQDMNKNHAHWATVFMNNLFEILSNADVSTTLSLNLYPQGILKQALHISGIADCVFPIGHLEMNFDQHGNVIIGGQRYAAQVLLNQDEFILGEIFRAVRL